MNMQTDKTNSRKIQAEEMKLHIMEVALSVFASKGFSNTSIKELAQKAGISQGLMYHYFESKETLLIAVVETYGFLPQLRKVIASDNDLSFHEVLTGIANDFLALLESRSMLFQIFLQESNTNPKVRKIWGNLCREGAALLNKFILSRIASGEIRDHNAEVTSRSLFYTLVMAHTTRDIFKSSKITLNDFVETVLNNLTNGISVDCYRK